MKLNVVPYRCLIEVGIAVTAEVRAGIICSYISSCQAVAVTSGILLRRRIKGTTDGTLKDTLGHASVCLNSVFAQLSSFKTCSYGNAVFLGYLGKVLSYIFAFGVTYVSGLIEILYGLVIQI